MDVGRRSAGTTFPRKPFTTPLPQDLLTSYKKLFAYYRTLGERAMEQLTFDELTADDDARSNSIAVIVKHLAGNMKSRWTDFTRSDGFSRLAALCGG
ncbi:DUF1572 family protein [Neolewinella xylanilytica]|uniref:DUF1572 family protein n=1 Tax=Neolewinella xylanilytica TaxID=1514080 RepID=UPI000CEB051C|nr:DUF1572 family protein [Neolewinella xylanilytica]